MTPRSLFIVILRVLGILSLKALFVEVPELIATILMFFRGYPLADGLFMFVLSLFTVALYLGIAYYLIFKADFLVTKFGLDQHFTEPVLNLNINARSVLTIAIVVTGFLVLIFEIPEFCSIIYRKLQLEKANFFQSSDPDWSPAVFSGVKIIIGLLVIGERKRILQFLVPEEAMAKKED